jgi:flagellar biosynthesis protein
MNNTNETANKPKQAIALNYKQGENKAPRVVAKGVGFIAEQILAAAQQHAIPVYQNKTLSSVLMAVELDREIPQELYKAVAEVLAYVYRLDQKLRKQ